MRSVDRRLLAAAPAARRLLLASPLLALVGAVALVVEAVAIGRAVAAVADGDVAIAPELAAIVVALLVRAGVAWGDEALGLATAARVGDALRARLVGHLLAARPDGLGRERAGEVATVATAGVEALDPYFGRLLPALAQGAVVPAVAIAAAFVLDPLSALILLATLPLIPVFGILVGKETERRAAGRLATLALLGARFHDTVRGLATLRAHGRGRDQVDRIGAAADAYRRETMATLRIAFLSALVLELAATIGTAVVAVQIGLRLVGGHLGLAAGLAVLVLAPEVYAPLRNAAAQFHASADGLAASRRLLDLLELEPAVARGADAVPSPAQATIALEGVSLTYADRMAPALADASLAIAPGERVAIVGPSGAGKSTVARLLLGLADPGAGAVTVGGHDLRDLDRAAWRRRIAWLPQHPHLGAGTLRDAVRAGDGRLDDTRLRAALADAGAGDLLAGLPLGLDTPLGPGGHALSGGERRRVALARALARDADVLLLDEPDASLDGLLVEDVAALVRRQPRTRTVIAITHDPRVAEACDRAIRIVSGRVVPEPVGALR